MFRIKRPYTEKFKKSTAYKGQKKWNGLPETFHHISDKQLYKAMIDRRIREKSEKANLNNSQLVQYGFD